ncbi:MAG: hypothetical protein IJU89_03125, partial [Alphaproteobacteria bacterium]|nr:hypothetical protein [Alphaproteobacteria bacterium]
KGRKMKIVTIIEDNPITGVRYGTVEISQYNNDTQRRIDRYTRLRNQTLRMIHKSRTKHK